MADLRRGQSLLNSTLSSPPSSAPVLRQWWSDGGRLLHADSVEHESHHFRMRTRWGYKRATRIVLSSQRLKYTHVHIDW